MAHVRTFKDLQDEALAWLDEAGDADSTLTLVKQAVQAAQEQRLTQERWPFMLWEPVETITLIPGVQTYSLHPEFLRPLSFRNRTSQGDLQEVFDHNMLLQGDWRSTSGWDDKFTMWSRSPVAQQPLVASVLTVTSSSGSDTLVGVSVRGDTADGVTTEVLTVAGGPGSVLFTRIINVTKMGTWIGALTLSSNSGVITNLKLFPSEYGRSYQRIQLIGAPTAADVIEYRFYRQPSPLILDYDIPDIPPPFQELLVWEALLTISAYNEFDPSMVALWQDNRDKVLLAMQHSLNNPQSVGMTTNYTSYVPR